MQLHQYAKASHQESGLMCSLECALPIRSELQRDVWFLSSVLRCKEIQKKKKEEKNERNRSNTRSVPRTAWVWRDLKCTTQGYPEHCPFPPPALSTRPQKHRWDVKLPEISCDNKQLLSSEIRLYSLPPSPVRIQVKWALPATSPLMCASLLGKEGCGLGVGLCGQIAFSAAMGTGPSPLERKSPAVFMTGLHLGEWGAWRQGANSLCLGYIRDIQSNADGQM